MQGLMMNRPLRIADILAHAAKVHPAGEVISVREEGDTHRATYPEIAVRVAQLAHALLALGVREGDRVGTLAFNGHRHLELYYAISGIGAVCHTINPRLPDDQLQYIIQHAGDRIIFADPSLVPILERLAPSLPPGLRYCVMTDDSYAPDSPLSPFVYESLLEDRPDTFRWPELPEETAAGLCYTSGTTGDPKGALFSHRSNVLHSLFLAVAVPDVLRVGRRILPVVPLFHVNAWGLPYAAPLTGASLILPGAKLDGASLFALMERERVYSGWGVPTVWLGLLAQIDTKGRVPDGLGDVVIGGSAAPAAMIARFEALGVNVCHAWGMTEMSPVGTQGNLAAHHANLSQGEKLAQKARQGQPLFGVDLKISDETGARLPSDGVSVGALHVRGNTVISGYFGDDDATTAAFDEDGWFKTGDIATLHPDGTLTIADRTKDVIKSGGEWISSIDLENVAMAHPGVKNCAVIAIVHEKWGERPLLVVVPTDDRPAPTELLDLLAERFAKWQLPDDIVFVDTLPLTATGKVSKRTLREMFKDYRLPDG